MLKKFFYLVFCTFLGTDLLFAKELNVYSYRHYDLDGKLFKLFQKKTGIKVNAVTGKADALMERLEREGKNSPADIVITADAGRLYRLKEKDLLQSVQSSILEKRVPSIYRDPDNMWFAFTKRARVVYYNPDKVQRSELTTYEDLTSPKWKGRIMVRSSNNIYNQSLMGAIIAHHDEKYALKWANGIVNNMAKKPPKGNDRSQAVAIYLGIGDIAIANTYYMGAMKRNKDKEQRKASKKLKMAFVTFEKTGGTHINVSGAGVTKYSKNKENAIKFIEFLTSKKIQKMFMNYNSEYPINKDVKWNRLLRSWGNFKEDTLPVYLLGKNNSKAVQTFDKSNWR